MGGQWCVFLAYAAPDALLFVDSWLDTSAVCLDILTGDQGNVAGQFRDGSYYHLLLDVAGAALRDGGDNSDDVAGLSEDSAGAN